jgi:phenylacetate-CoA ligase
MQGVDNVTVAKHIAAIRTKKSSYWTREEKRMRESLYRSAAAQVPAYKDLLKKNKVTTDTKFDSLPYTSKSSYLQKYPLEDLVWNGSLAVPLVFTSTSGSTGQPFYFPRGAQLDKQNEIIKRLFFENNINSITSPTLVIICFGMGVWIGGVLTYQAFVAMRSENYPISILTPGINKQEIFRALTNIGNNFKQIIIGGYAPFVKDIIDEAPANGIDFKKIDTRFIFAAEAFTETFRDYSVNSTGLKNPLIDTMNIYGSADIGSMAFETPFAILARRLATANTELFKALFGKINRTPTLAQYNPRFISFEAIDGQLYLTGNNTIPLIRYGIGDHGGVFTFDSLNRIFSDHGIDLRKEAVNSHIGELIYQLPFVYVYERIDLSTTLYGLQIYPETIREAILEKPFLDYYTGKLTLITKFCERQNQYLEVNIEVRKDQKITKSFINRTLDNITTHLIMKNSEYSELYKSIGARARPKLIPWPAEHPTYFKSGAKQRWVMK